MKELSRNEKLAIEWLEEHNFKYRIVKQWLSKTVFELSRDGLTYEWELTYDVSDIDRYMDIACMKNHQLRLELQELRKQAGFE